jgi:hypothetical protein
MVNSLLSVVNYRATLSTVLLTGPCQQLDALNTLCFGDSMPAPRQHLESVLFLGFDTYAACCPIPTCCPHRHK